jgi:hypothetical protein
MLGTIRARISHLTNKFRKRGYANYGGHCKVPDARLKVAANENRAHITTTRHRASGVFQNCQAA